MKALFIAGVLYVLAVSTSLFQSTYQQEPDFRYLGDSISLRAQQVLIKNLLQAVQKSGTATAVDFCNVKAIPLTDSLSKKYGVIIQRISTRNRNPINAATTDDAKILGQFDLTKKPMLRDTLLKNAEDYTYYKPIRVAMPACLNCHGNPGTDIDRTTLQVINNKYPNDKATGYQLNDLRGAWKLTFTKKPE